MANLLQNNSKAQLAATALVSGVVVASSIFGYQALRRQVRVDTLKRNIPELGSSHQGDKNTGMKGMEASKSGNLQRSGLGREGVFSIVPVVMMDTYGLGTVLINEAKLTEFGAASQNGLLSKEDERSAKLAERARNGDYDDELILEQLSRNRSFLTDPGLASLRSAFVIIVGCGGVGSHCASALARSGVSSVRLIDFDQVTLSSLNRHAVATLADVGTPKVLCIKRRLEQITPWTKFDLRNELFGASSADNLLGALDGKTPDFVIDAIDNIDSKVALLEYCHKRGIKVISSMGAGCKSDPTRIFIGDISTSTEDPLSRSTRQRLRKLGVASGIPVVYSTEKPGPGKAQLLPLPEDEFLKGSVGELGVLPDFRVRILPVLGTMPAVFGYTVANHVILSIAGYPFDYIPAKGREKMYDGILAALQGAEERLARQTTPGDDAQGLKIPLTTADVGYYVEEIFKGKSVISGVSTRLLLVRWKPIGGDGSSSMDVSVSGQKVSSVKLIDLVCITKEEATIHEREVIGKGRSPAEFYPPEVLERVKQRFAEERRLSKFR